MANKTFLSLQRHTYIFKSHCGSEDLPEAVFGFVFVGMSPFLGLEIQEAAYFHTGNGLISENFPFAYNKEELVKKLRSHKASWTGIG